MRESAAAEIDAGVSQNPDHRLRRQGQDGVYTPRLHAAYCFSSISHVRQEMILCRKIQPKLKGYCDVFSHFWDSLFYFISGSDFYVLDENGTHQIATEPSRDLDPTSWGFLPEATQVPHASVVPASANISMPTFRRLVNFGQSG